MIDHLPVRSDQLNSYNVAQLQFALAADPKCDPAPLLNDLSPSSSTSSALIPSPADIDYDSRRMSSSATSAADTDTSALSRGEKRPPSPELDSFQKKSRPLDHNVWDATHPQSRSPSLDDPATAGPLPSSSDAKVQLPSIFTTFEDSFRPDIRRSSLPNLSDRSSRIRHAPYPPTGVRMNNYTPTTQSSLSTYQFPPSADPASPDSAKDSAGTARSRLTSDSSFAAVSYGDQSPFSAAPPLTNGTTPSTSTFSPSNFDSPLSTDYHSRPQNLSAFSDSDTWATSPSGIIRPSSTPGQLSGPSSIKYEDTLRHSSFSAPISQTGMFAGSARISGQHDRRALSTAGIKNEWSSSFPSPDFLLPSTPSYSSSSSTMPPASISSSPPRTAQSVPNSTLVDRPQRKRGKLPKETTDFLKAWLHRHSDHPYPSEDEKKQLCHATGLSMSQVSNWMINARRRILAPAHRAASGPTTTAPFPPSSRIVSTSAMLDHSGRRASMPADTLQLYHPMSLQSLSGHHHPHHHHHHSSADFVSSTRNILGLPTRSAHQLTGPGGTLDFGHNRMMFVPGQGPHSASSVPPPNHFLTSPTVAISGPASAHPFSQSSHSPLSPQHQQNMYPGFISTPRVNSQQQQQQQQQQHDQQQQNYYSNGQSQSGSAPGSGYPTPQ
jgi:hypothetical protein